jgi:hypothetical protein
VITRKPALSFSKTIRLERDQVGEDIPRMLPRKVEEVTAEQVAEVETLIRHNEGLTLELLGEGR